MSIVPAEQSWAAEYPFEPKSFEVRDGLTMSYLDEGPRAGETIVMFHGNPTWSFYYRNVIKQFRDRYRCIAMDHIGCGLSDKPQSGYDYRLVDRVDDAEKLLDHLGVERATFVLHDWGGAIGMGVARRKPERVERLVVFNTAAFRSKRIPLSINICKIPVFGELSVLGFNGFARVAQFRAIYDRDNLSGPIGDAYLAPYDSWANRIATLKFVHDIPMKPSHPSWDELTRIDKELESFSDRPTLIVWGNDDFCFNEDFREEWERRFPDAEVHSLDDASHYVLEDATEEILVWMEDFLAR